MGRFAEAPSDVERRGPQRKRSLKKFMAFIGISVLISGLTWGGMGIKQADMGDTVGRKSLDNLLQRIKQADMGDTIGDPNAPLQYQVVNADQIMSDSSQKSYNWDRKYLATGSKVESLDYDVTIMGDGRLNVKELFKVRLDVNGGSWSQVYHRIPISPDGYKSIEVTQVRNVTGDYDMDYTTFANPDNYSDSSWNSSQAGKWFLAKSDANNSSIKASIKGEFKQGNSGYAVIGANIDKMTSGEVELQFDYILTPGKALQKHKDGVTTELFSMADMSTTGDSPIRNLKVTINRPKDETKRSAWIKLPESIDPSWQITPDQVSFEVSNILFNEIPSAVVTVPTDELDLPADTSTTNQTAETYAKDTLLNGDGAFLNDDGTVSIGNRISMAQAQKMAEQQTLANRKKAQDDRNAKTAAYKENLEKLDKSKQLVKILSGSLTAILLMLFLEEALSNAKTKRRKMRNIEDAFSADEVNLDPFKRQILFNMMINGKTEVTDLNIIDSSLNLLSANTDVHHKPTSSANKPTSSANPLHRPTWFDLNGWLRKRADAHIDRVSSWRSSANDFNQIDNSTLVDPIHVYPGPSVIYKGIDGIDSGIPEEQVSSLVNLARRDGVDTDSTVTISINPEWFNNNRHYVDDDLKPLMSLLEEWGDDHEGDLTFDLDEMILFYQNLNRPSLKKSFSELRKEIDKYIKDKIYTVRDVKIGVLPIAALVSSGALGVLSIVLSPGLAGVGMMKSVFSLGMMAPAISWMEGALLSSKDTNVISLEKAITIADKVMNKNDENIALSKKRPTSIATDKRYIRVQDTVLYGNSKRSAVRMVVESKEQNGGIQSTSEIGR